MLRLLIHRRLVQFGYVVNVVATNPLEYCLSSGERFRSLITEYRRATHISLTKRRVAKPFNHVKRINEDSMVAY